MNYLLLLFPIIIFVILFAGADVAKKGEYTEDAWGLDQAKALRVFAALMVMLHHLVQTISQYGNVDKGPVTIWNSLGILFTSVFFFFSGFGLYKGYRTKPDYLKGFLRRRLLTIYIPFQITNILYLIVFWNSKVKGVGDAITSFFGLTLINSNAWFVVELLLLYIAFFICFRYARSEKTAIICLTGFTVFMVVGSLLLGHYNSPVRHWFRGEWWYNTTLIFILGILVAKYESRVKAFLMKGYRFILPALAVLFAGWYLLEEFILSRFGYYQEWEGHPGYGAKFLSLPFQVILCAIFVFLLLHISLKVRYKNRVLLFLGGISFEIYLIHEMFRELLPGGPGRALPDILYLALVYILSVVAACLLAFVDRKMIDAFVKRKG